MVIVWIYLLNTDPLLDHFTTNIGRTRYYCQTSNHAVDLTNDKIMHGIPSRAETGSAMLM